LNRSIEEKEDNGEDDEYEYDDEDGALRIGRSEIPSNSTILLVPPGMDFFSSKRSAIRRA